jgi:hypothetical protein
MADIIGLLAHGEQRFEELSNTFLWRTGGARASNRGIMNALRAMLRGLTKHLRKIGSRATERKSDRGMRHKGSNPLLSWNGVLNEALHKCHIVGSKPLLNRPLELLVYKVRHINLPLTVRVRVVHEVDVEATTGSSVSNLAHNSGHVNASQGTVEIVHASIVRRRWLLVHIWIRIAEKKVLGHHPLRRLRVNAETTTVNTIITKAPSQLIKRCGVVSIPSHPRNLPAVARMEVGSAEELTHHGGAILLFKVGNGPKIHLLQGWLNKEEIGLPVGTKMLGVETMWCHKGVQSSRVIVIIPHSKLRLSPKPPIKMKRPLSKAVRIQPPQISLKLHRTSLHIGGRNNIRDDIFFLFFNFRVPTPMNGPLDMRANHGTLARTMSTRSGGRS